MNEFDGLHHTTLHEYTSLMATQVPTGSKYHPSVVVALLAMLTLTHKVVVEYSLDARKTDEDVKAALKSIHYYIRKNKRNIKVFFDWKLSDNFGIGDVTISNPLEYWGSMKHTVPSYLRYYISAGLPSYKK